MASKLSIEDTTQALDLLTKLIETYTPANDEFTRYDEFRSLELLEVLCCELIEANYEKKLHHDVRVKVAERYPHLTAAEVRKVATQAIKKTREEA